MWQMLAGLGMQMAGQQLQNQGNIQTSNLDKRRQYFQQLLAGMSPIFSYEGARKSTGENNTGDMMNLAKLLSGQDKYNPYMQQQPMQQPMMNQQQQPMMNQQYNPYAMNYYGRMS